MRTVRTLHRTLRLLWNHKGFTLLAFLLAELPGIPFALAFLFSLTDDGVLILAVYAYTAAVWLTSSLADALIVRFLTTKLRTDEAGTEATIREVCASGVRVAVIKLSVGIAFQVGLTAVVIVGGLAYAITSSLGLAAVLSGAAVVVLAPVFLTFYLWAIYAQQFTVSRGLGILDAVLAAARHVASRLRRSLELCVAYAFVPVLLAFASLVAIEIQTRTEDQVAVASLVLVNVVLVFVGLFARSVLPAALMATAVSEDAS